jgi:hypothetical protein
MSEGLQMPISGKYEYVLNSKVHPEVERSDVIISLIHPDLCMTRDSRPLLYNLPRSHIIKKLKYFLPCQTFMVVLYN